MGINQHYLAWDEPLVEKAAQLLLEGWDGKLLDFSEKMLLVPTRHAGRMLRERLAIYTAEKGGAYLSPQVIIPADISVMITGRQTIASKLESVIAWVNVLRNIRFKDYSYLFPVEVEHRNIQWLMRTAKVFDELKRTLADNAHNFNTVSNSLNHDFVEKERWNDLAKLEKIFLEELKSLKLNDAHEAYIKASVEPKLPEGIKQIYIIGVSDLSAIDIKILKKYAKKIPLHVVTYAPAELSKLFDDFGQPDHEAWATRAIDIPSPTENIILTGTPESQVDQAMAYVKQAKNPEKTVTIGAADPDLALLFDKEFKSYGIPVYNAEGHFYRNHMLYLFINQISECVRTRSFLSLRNLLQNPSFYKGLDKENLLPIHDMLLAMDALAEKHMPQFFDDVVQWAEQEYPELYQILKSLDILLHPVLKENFSDTLVHLLETFHKGHLLLSQSSSPTENYQQVADDIVKLLKEIKLFSLIKKNCSTTDLLELMLFLLRDNKLYDDHSVNAIEIKGWFELLWDDAPCLILAGINEGAVPEIVTSDVFLPHSFRKFLGLKGNDEKQARDVYILTTLIESRRNTGSVIIFYSKTSGTGDPLRPSNLLLRCSRKELPHRTKDLFASPGLEKNIPFQLAWKLKPKMQVKLNKLSVTQFKSYLACPFRFYLEHALGMRSLDLQKAEMNALDFGELCHKAIEAFSRDNSLKNCTDVEQIQKYLYNYTSNYMYARYGKNLSVPLIIQVEAVIERLSAFAKIRAECRAEGWIVEHVEWKFKEIDYIKELKVSGTIDLIEKNEHTGQLRIIDYKTTDKNITPETAHFRKLKRTESLDDFRPYRIFNYEDETYVWTDLQLPLYYIAAQTIYGDELSMGYFNLPKAIGMTSISIWDRFSPELLEAAKNCAEGVVIDVMSNRFYPPSEKVDYDAFSDLFFGNLTEEVTLT